MIITTFKGFRLTLLTFVLSCTTIYISAQPEAGMPSEPGKCYAKCLMPDKFETVKKTIPVYSNIENVDYEIETVILKPTSSKWVKKKANRNCLSDDPEDCLVWCLVEQPAIAKEVKVPINPDDAGKLTYETFETRQFVQKGGLTQWMEVVCGPDMTKDFVQELQLALVEKGYDLGESGVNSNLGQETKAALVLYQRENDLPVGQMDFETLASLGIIPNKQKNQKKKKKRKKRKRIR